MKKQPLKKKPTPVTVEKTDEEKDAEYEALALNQKSAYNEAPDHWTHEESMILARALEPDNDNWFVDADGNICEWVDDLEPLLDEDDEESDDDEEDDLPDSEPTTAKTKTTPKKAQAVVKNLGVAKAQRPLRRIPTRQASATEAGSTSSDSVRKAIADVKKVANKRPMPRRGA